MNLGDRLKALREDYEPRLTQKKLAEAVGLTQRKISYIELGHTDPSIEDLFVLCRFFNVSADYLIGLPNNMPYPKK